jgi:hypothetical protein
MRKSLGGVKLPTSQGAVTRGGSTALIEGGNSKLAITSSKRLLVELDKLKVSRVGATRYA